jgi:hypothetical protein
VRGTGRPGKNPFAVPEDVVLPEGFRHASLPVQGAWRGSRWSSLTDTSTPWPSGQNRWSRDTAAGRACAPRRRNILRRRG